MKPSFTAFIPVFIVATTTTLSPTRRPAIDALSKTSTNFSFWSEAVQWAAILQPEHAEDCVMRTFMHSSAIDSTTPWCLILFLMSCFRRMFCQLEFANAKVLYFFYYPIKYEQNIHHKIKLKKIFCRIPIFCITLRRVFNPTKFI